MEIRIIGRGALAGVIAGVLGFVFARIFAEPVINQAIAYESGRDSWLSRLNQAAGRTVAPDGPEIFSRTIQSTIGLATGIIAFSAAMGALIAVAYLVMHGRFNVRPRNLVWMIAAFGFAGVYLLPFVKYPANPPATGPTFTIGTRAQLYLTMVGGSLVLLGLAVYLARRLMPRFGMTGAVVLSAIAFLVGYGVLIGLLPSLGNLGADVLWKFRWSSILNQLIIWTTIALVFGSLLDRFLSSARPAPQAEQQDNEPVGAAS
ncbi:MAG TPA: CbtA family protein [Streptosporangiaceae bacterium]|jgi:hypothetical protein